MPEEVKEEVDQVKVVNDDHDVDESDDHYDIYGDDDNSEEEVNVVKVNYRCHLKCFIRWWS